VTATAKTGDGPVEMARMFKLAKDSAIKSRTQAINQLQAVLVAADPALRESLSELSSRVLIRRCAQLDPTAPTDATSAAAWTLRLLAHRIECLTKEIDDLNRGGDRQANAALYRIALSRLRWDQRTRDYLNRRIAEGRTPREAIRCLKRYIARELYPLITKPQPTPVTDPSAT